MLNCKRKWKRQQPLSHTSEKNVSDLLDRRVGAVAVIVPDASGECAGLSRGYALRAYTFRQQRGSGGNHHLLRVHLRHQIRISASTAARQSGMETEGKGSQHYENGDFIVKV